MALCDYIDFAYERENDFYEWLNGEGFKKDYQNEYTEESKIIKIF